MRALPGVLLVLLMQPSFSDAAPAGRLPRTDDRFLAHLHIPAEARFAVKRRSDGDIMLGRALDAPRGTTASLHIGPIAIEGGGDGKARVGSYRLEDVDVLGADVSGSVDGRGAKFQLRWRTGE